MKTALRISLAVLLGACASRGPVDLAAPEPTPVAEAETCSDCIETAVEGAAEVAEASPPSEINVEADCLAAAQLAHAGEHKPAVDTLSALLDVGATCPEEVLSLVADSQQKLDTADAAVRKGRQAMAEGDGTAAREMFAQALEVYPKYYWVQKLAQDLPPDSPGQVARLREAASKLIASGRPEEALKSLEEAAALAPADADLNEEIARFRTELGDSRLGGAHRAQRAGDLGRAIELTMRAISVQPDYPVRDRVIDFARRLGLKLFSGGELVEARSLWQATLALDAGNELLRQYIGEVEARLESLDQIRKVGGQ